MEELAVTKNWVHTNLWPFPLSFLRFYRACTHTRTHEHIHKALPSVFAKLERPIDVVHCVCFSAHSFVLFVSLVRFVLFLLFSRRTWPSAWSTHKINCVRWLSALCILLMSCVHSDRRFSEENGNKQHAELIFIPNHTRMWHLDWSGRIDIWPSACDREDSQQQQKKNMPDLRPENSYLHDVRHWVFL